ncbi:PASTA domain-containing protein [Streptomyces sp. NPDC047081]|uniref:PASTA domain-containing protein n=1 Tax=Streptomyces sp. NPDC047081 TaxID=3154706 RepID=UPI0033F19257
MTSYGDARPSGCTPFEEQLVNAMNDYADSADAPDFDAPGIVRRTRRRRTVGIAAVAAALILGGGGTALASMSGGTEAHSAVASSGPTQHGSKLTTVLVGKPGDSFTIDFAGLDLAYAKQLLAKAQLQLGAVSKRPVTGCKPGTVFIADPHSPKTVPVGGTVNLVLCSG